MRKPQNNWKQVLLLAVVLLGAVGLLAALNQANQTATNATIQVDHDEDSHDHDGDGKPDHATGAHE